MKKIVFIAVLLACVNSMMNAQVTQEELDKAYQELLEAKDSKKDKEDTYQALLDSVMYQNAIYCLEENDFVLEAEKLTSKRGNWRYVTANTNFISLQGDRATVQIAFEGAHPGANGIGGVTLDGRASNFKMKTDKKGTKHLSFLVTGAAISARIDLSLPEDTNKVTATVTPNFSSNRFTLTGHLWPTSQSMVFKGRAL